MRRRPRDPHDDAPRQLAHPLKLRNGKTLVTLEDAANTLMATFFTTLKHRALEYAIELLMKAEKTGRRSDIKAATDQVALVLRHSSLMD